MKKRVIPTSEPVSQAAIARHYKVNGGSVSAWVKAGCPRLSNGTFVLADVEAWIRRRDEKKAQRADLREEKLAQEIEKIRRDIALRDLDLEKQSGRVHDKAACAASMTELRARESAILHGLAQRFSGAFPEAVKQTEWLEREVDQVIGRLQG